MLDRDSILYKIRRQCQRIGYYIFSKELLAKIYYRIVVGGGVNIRNPSTFNEKIHWLKLYYYPNNQLVVKCADKYAARDYVKEKGLASILTHHFGYWENANQIQWDSLPQKFILKCNHGCAYNILCPNKDDLKFSEIKQKINKWLREDFGKYNIEPHYSMIKKKVVFCEEYLGEVIDDYKFFCFNGKPDFLYIARGMIDDRNCSMGFYSLNGSKIPVQRDDYRDMNVIQFPSFFSNMLKDAEILAADFPFVRVDFFVANNKYYFAEFTFSPGAGMMPIKPDKYNVEWGKKINIDSIIGKTKF